jgi:Outer membrane protein beta-barrel domain
MNHTICRLLLTLLLLSASHAYAEMSYIISPSVGSASIRNINGYDNSPYLRVDGSFHPIPEFGINLFAVSYSGFKTSGSGNGVDIKLNGYGAGVTGRWPVHPHVQPYVRLDYMLWNAEASGLGRTLGNDKGGSAGFAVGVQCPIRRIFGVKAEVSGYNNVSGANIRQFSLGLVIEL